MQFTAVTSLLFGLFASQVLACGTPGEQCNSPDAQDCQCNAGNLVRCTIQSGGGFAWDFAGDCPPNGDGLACVNGGCVVT